MHKTSPKRLDCFMAEANAAYYAKKNPFEDFITSPEISQIFGELIAVWTIMVGRSIMEKMPQSASFCLVEAGPGRGTLMADILRVMRKAAPDLYTRCKLYLVETSPRLREIQRIALKDHEAITVQWLDSVYELPEMPMVFLANEFLDALPIRQFVKISEQAWDEIYVQDGMKIREIVERCPESPIFHRPVAIGDVVEICEEGQAIIAFLGKHVFKHNGAALFIDYGYAQPVWGDSLQALAEGKPVSPFIEPGCADLTAHIDFCSLAEIARNTGATVYGIQTQGRFLSQLGIMARAQKLSAHANREEQQQIQAAIHRLIAPEQMGTLFKVMALCSPNIAEPPGFMEDERNNDNG